MTIKFALIGPYVKATDANDEISDNISTSAPASGVNKYWKGPLDDPVIPGANAFYHMNVIRDFFNGLGFSGWNN